MRVISHQASVVAVVDEQNEMHDSVERADNVLVNHRSKEESSLKSAGSSA